MESAQQREIIGEFIKETREKKGFTQAELAARMNVNPQNISSYERGERAPGVLWMIRLADAVGILPAELFREMCEKIEANGTTK